MYRQKTFPAVLAQLHHSLKLMARKFIPRFRQYVQGRKSHLQVHHARCVRWYARNSSEVYNLAFPSQKWARAGSQEAGGTYASEACSPPLLSWK